MLENFYILETFPETFSIPEISGNLTFRKYPETFSVPEISGNLSSGNFQGFQHYGALKKVRNSMQKV